MTKILIVSEKFIKNPNETLNVWIGATNLINIDAWTWTDESAFSYANWRTVGLVDMQKRCASLHLGDGVWEADDCYAKKQFICVLNEAEASKFKML